MTENERLVEWTNSTTKDRQTLYHLVQALRSNHGWSWDEVYVKAHGKPIHRSEHDEGNFRKGTIGHTKIAPIFRWIAEHHLTFASENAPELFSPSHLTRWSSFIAEHGTYDQLNPILLNALGLSKRSSRDPIHSLRIRLGDDYCFELNSGITGAVLALEGYEGDYYPMSLHVDAQSFLTPFEAGKHLLPFDPKTNQPLALRDDDHRGIHSFIFVVAPKNLLTECLEGFILEKALNPKLLDELALTFRELNQSTFEVHRLNLVFTS